MWQSLERSKRGSIKERKGQSLLIDDTWEAEKRNDSLRPKGNENIVRRC